MSEAERVHRLRGLALALPLVTERPSHGAPSWFVEAAPMFASLDDHHHGADHLAVWLAAPPGVAATRVADDPATFFVPPYVGTRGWLGVRLAASTDWDEVADLLSDAWDVVAKPAQRGRGGL